MLMLDILQENGCRVIEAIDGPSALKILDSNVRIDLLITDVALPGGMNGRQEADAGRRTRPDLKVLFITGYAENVVVGNGRLAPGMEIVTEPFEIAVLGQKVRDMIERWPGGYSDRRRPLRSAGDRRTYFLTWLFASSLCSLR